MAVAVPFPAPLQVTFVLDEIPALNMDGWETVIVFITVHPLLSVTVTE